MKFPPAFIEQLRSHLTLSEIIGRRIAIKRHGREYQALCPFHKEKSPSFTINDEKGFYHCFGCAAHGDAINFVKEYDGISWQESVEKLAMEAGLSLPVKAYTREEEARYRQTLSLYDLMNAATQWFEQNLRQSVGLQAMHYVQQRGLKEETLRTFRVGFAPAGRDALKQAMLKLGYTEKQLVQAGLLVVPDEGAPYDRFRERLMFPIRDVKGRVIAFGGRILPSAPNASTLAKYVNSPETELFKKGEILFNLDLAKKPARDVNAVIVTEGYMDVIALHQAGITHAVAPLGTALTDRHLDLLWKLVPEPTICLDGDAAGRRAMARVSDLALPKLQPSLSLRFAFLPKGEDPDSMVRQFGPQAMLECIARAAGLAEVVWDMHQSAIGQKTPERRAALEQTVLRLADQIQDRTVRSHYRAFFQEKLWAKKPKQDSGSRLAGSLVSLERKRKSLQALPERIQRIEMQLLKLLIMRPELLHRADVEEAAHSLECAHGIMCKLLSATMEAFMHHPELSPKELMTALAAKGLNKDAERLIANLTVPVPKSVQNGEGENQTHDAFEFWQQVWAAYTLAKMKLESDKAVQDMATALDEDALNRFLELQGQYQRLQQAHFNQVVKEPTG